MNISLLASVRCYCEMDPQEWNMGNSEWGQPFAAHYQVWWCIAARRGHCSFSSCLIMVFSTQTKMCVVCQHVCTMIQGKTRQNMSAMEKPDKRGSDWGLNCILWVTQCDPVFIAWFSPTFLRPLGWPSRNFKNIVFHRLKLGYFSRKIGCGLWSCQIKFIFSECDMKSI